MMFTRDIPLIFIAAGLAGGCAREKPDRQPSIGRADIFEPGSMEGTGSSALGSGHGRQLDPSDPGGIMESAREGMQFALQKAAEFQDLRTKQVDKLDRRVERIQRLLEASKLDEAEVMLVDIHWIPVEPGKTAEADFLRIYDAKRTALARFIESKRQRVP